MHALEAVVLSDYEADGSGRDTKNQEQCVEDDGSGTFKGIITK